MIEPLDPPQRLKSLLWTVGPVTIRPSGPNPARSDRYYSHPRKGDFTMNLLDDQQVVLSVQATDDQGNAVANLGTLVATSSDETVLTVTDNGDGTYTAVTTGTLGSATVTITDDIDGDGTGDFSGSVAFDVVPGTVSEIAITPGTPTTRA